MGVGGYGSLLSPGRPWLISEISSTSSLQKQQ
jgi:hypothetical protein